MTLTKMNDDGRRKRRVKLLGLTKKDTVYQISDKQYLCVLELHSSFYLICTTIAISVVRLDIDHLLTTLTLFSDIGFLTLVIERYHFRIIHIIPCTKIIIVINRHNSSSITDYDVKNEPTMKLSQIEVWLSTFISNYFHRGTRKTYVLAKSVGLW
jgi:hypothetical protein